MTEVCEYTVIDAPIGKTLVAWRGDALRSIRLGPKQDPPARWRFVDGADNEATRQLRAYFAGELRVFDLALDVVGTDFQKRVWEALAAIPFGETRSYAEVAAEIGRPTAVRAVGAANGRNPIPIVIPCHRVIASDGGLGGYAGGLALKSALLTFERLGYWDPSLVRTSPV